MSSDSGVDVNLFFAHEIPRESQKEMIADGIRALNEGGFLIAAAPTGIGKTAAALSSALAFSNLYNTKPENPKILFLTGRQSQHRIVVDTVREINKGLPSGFSKIRLVDIIGRESMCKVVDRSTGKCSCEEGVSESERKSRGASLKEFILNDPIHVNRTIEVARKRNTCPWAVARSAARETNILVCDYNHVFVESVRDSSLPTMGIDLENSILIIDEAHNLPDRIRGGLERRITDRVFRRALSDIEEFKENLEKDEKALDIPESKKLKEVKSLEKQITALRDDAMIRRWFEEKTSQNRSSKGGDIKVETQEFLDVVANAIEGLDEEEQVDVVGRVRIMISRLMTVVVEEDEDLEEDEQNDCTRLAEILDICIRYRRSAALALVFDNELEEPRVTSHLLDPSVVGEQIFHECLGSIIMSGTLFPPGMYSEILGVPGDRATCKEYASDFPLENRPVLIANDVTSKYTERENSYGPIGDHIKSVIKNTNGNVAVFAPSYSMLGRIYDDVSNWRFGKSYEIEE